MRIFVTFFVLLTLSSCAFGPVGLSKKALKKLDNQDFEKAEQLVAKALEKDSLLPAPQYAKSKLLVAYDSHEFYDSAYFYILSAQSILDTLDIKSKAKHAKQGFDSVTFTHHKNLIDSLAFQWAQRVNTESGFNEFLAKHPTAKQVQQAKSKRNAIAFATAKAENTYQGYKLFMEKYPEAIQVREARNRYEKLYFDKSTADGSVSSYIRFLEKHPETPYRKEAEQKIFEVSTAAHSVAGYELFLKNYPQSHLRKKAINYAYHVAKSSGVSIHARYLSDSLKKVRALEGHHLFAFLEDGKFGFINKQGHVVLKPQFGQINAQYKCESTKDDFLLVDDKLKGRNGVDILDYQPEAVIDLGYGLLQVGSEGNWQILHKSGGLVRAKTFHEVKLLAGSMLALKYDDIWHLETISGRLLAADAFDEIYEQGPYIFFEKEGLIEVKTVSQLLKAIDSSPVRFDYLFSDYEILPDGNIWLETNYGEMIANQKLEELIPYGNQTINILNGSFLVKIQSEARLYDQSYQMIKALANPGNNQSWLIDKLDSMVWMFDLQDHTISTSVYDSAQLLGKNFLLVFKGDSVDTYFKDGLKVSFDKSTRFNVLGNESAEYLKVSGKKQMKLFNVYGSLLVDDKNNIEFSPVNNEVLIFTERNKKGLLDGKSGEVLLKANYDAIGNYNNGRVSLLKDKQFGLFDIKSSLLIAPGYDKNIINYNDSVFVVSQQDQQYFFSQDATLTQEGFNQIEYWSDAVAIVKDAKSWSFFNLQSIKRFGPSFRSYQIQKLPTGEKLLIIRGESGYGVYSDKRGEVVSPTYNDIVLLASDTEPLLFTEKHIKEAAFFVVIYYDLNGNALLKKAYEAKQYDRIYCD